MTLRDLTKELYEFMYDDPYNYFKRYFPTWENLPETAKKEWDKKVLRIREANLAPLN